MLTLKNHGLTVSNDTSNYPEIQYQCLFRRFQDIDEFSQAFHSHGLSMLQLTPGQFEGEVVRIEMDGLQLLRIASNSRIYTSGTKAVNGIIFSTSLNTPPQSLISHKTALPQHALFGFDPTREVSLVTPEQIQLAIVTVSMTKLQNYLQVIERDDLDTKFFQQNCIQMADDSQYNLRTYLQQLFFLATHNPDFLRRSQALIAGDLLPLLVNCFSAEVCPRLRILPFRRSSIVEEAEAFMITNLDQPLTLEDICQAAKTSKSALSYGFQDIFGISPIVFLKIRRLHGVRRALKISHPDTTTVLGTAKHFGFWHMGHFSRDYKHMFGESPSETLKNVNSLG